MTHYRNKVQEVVLCLLTALLSIHSTSCAFPIKVTTNFKSSVITNVLPYRGGTNASTSHNPTKLKLTSSDLAVAGALATIIGDIALHPIDCIKTLQQSNEGIGLSMIGAGTHILADKGIGGFFSGLGCYVVSDGCAGAIKFATYEALKRWVNTNVDKEYVGTAIFGCAALAFVASSVVLVPGELIKQRMQMGQVTSIRSGIANIWKNDGLSGFFTCYSGVFLRDIPYTMLELGLYDNFKTLYLKMKNRNSKRGEPMKPISQVEEIIAAAITGGITGYITNPLDVIKTKLMVDSAMYTGFNDCLRKTVTDYGYPSLFHGGGARVAWLMPFTAIYLPVYDLFKRRMEITGARSDDDNGGVRNVLKIKGGLLNCSSKRKGHSHSNIYSLDCKTRSGFISF